MNEEKIENKIQQGLLEKLVEYGQTDTYPFHMPGHKRRDIPDGFAGQYINPYGIDITEIDGFDNLHHAEGILKDAMEEAARIYGADRSWYLVNGSTCGLLSAIFAAVKHGGKILVARNCHKAVYHGIYLNHLEAEYLYPERIEEFGMNGGIRPEDVKAALERNITECKIMDKEGGLWKSEEKSATSVENATKEARAPRSEKKREGEDKKKIQAVLITSPTYEGIVSDIEKIAEIVHEYGLPLIVDEAHGAHFPFADRCKTFPKSALECGADVVIQSLHKTLPSFTQTAILHVKGKRVDQRSLEEALSMFQTSSPSYLFLSGIQRCIRYMDGAGRDEMAEYEKKLIDFFEEMKQLKTLQIFTEEIGHAYPSVAAWDPSKLVISTKKAKKYDGEALAEVLRRKYHLEIEMAAPTYVIAMTSLMDTKEGLDRLAAALSEIDESLTGSEDLKKEPEEMNKTAERKEDIQKQIKERNGSEREMCAHEEKAYESDMPGADSLRKRNAERKEKQEMRICQAMDAQKTSTELCDAVGKISAEFVYLYPPGIPIIIPGERFTREIVEKIMAYKAAKLPVQGTQDPAVDQVLTVADSSGI